MGFILKDGPCIETVPMPEYHRYARLRIICIYAYKDSVNTQRGELIDDLTINNF